MLKRGPSWNDEKVVEPLRGGAWWTVLGHWGRVLKGNNGTLSPPSFLCGIPAVR